MRAEVISHPRRMSAGKWALPIGILLLGAWIRFMQLDVAHFQRDQAMLIQHAWNLARQGVFPSHFHALSAGYSNFPLALYLDALPLFFVDSVYAVLSFHIGLNLAAAALCWWFSERYWGPRVAALATLLFVCTPWAILYSRRIWTNSLMPPFVMLWVIATCLAIHERRWRWLVLSWAAAWWLLQLHAGGIIFLFIILLLSLGYRQWRTTLYAVLGSVLGVLPVMPWLYAHVFGPAVLYLERMPYAGGGGIRYHTGPLVEFLTASQLANFFRGANWESLKAQLAPLQAAGAFWIQAYGGAALWILWQAMRRRDRIPERILALWLLMPLLFGLVSRRSYTNVYYLPLLPAPMLVLSIGIEQIRQRKRLLAHLITVTLCGLCALNLRSVLVSYQFVAAGLKEEDGRIWADGGGTPLGAQLAIASESRERIANGQMADILILLRPVLLVEHEMIAFAMPFHLRDVPQRLLDISAAHRVYPAVPTGLLWDENQVELPASYAGRVEQIATRAPYQLHRLPAGSAPLPHTPFDEQPEYANGLRLLGFDELRCAGAWRLHWTPGPADEEGDPVHFFVHLLDADGGGLAQSDLRAYDARDWRPGDHIVTEFDLGLELADLPIATIRVGLYRFSEGTQSNVGGIYALDEQGRPWEYAVDIPHEGKCSP